MVGASKARRPNDTVGRHAGNPARYNRLVSDARLAQALFDDDVARSRAMDPADKLLEGPRLFERTVRLVAAGVRHEHPHLTDDDVERLVLDRLALAERLQRS